MNKKALYESIMKNISKEIKYTLNERNMSYCRFENTKNDFADCVNALQDAIDNETSMDLSEYEARAMKRLADLAEEYIDLYNEYTENVNSWEYDEDDEYDDILA